MEPVKLSLKELHEFYYGAQDKYEHFKLGNCPFKAGTLIETKTVTFHGLKEGQRSTHCIPSSKSKEPRGVTNFSISPSSALETLEFQVGGQRFEKHNLFRELNSDVKIHLLNDNYIFPILEYHDVNIIFEVNCDVSIRLSYDIVELVNFDKSKPYELMTIQEQFTGDEKFNDTLVNKISLNYNHPILRLYAFLPDDVEDARLFLNRLDHNLVLTRKDNYYFIDFGEETSINFSRIDSIKLQVTTKTPHPEFKARVYAINKHLIRIMSGMAGLAFSK
jgi:hypothetical protein